VLAESCTIVRDNEVVAGLTGDSGGVLTAVCEQASTRIVQPRIEQEAASRIVGVGTESMEDHGRG